MVGGHLHLLVVGQQQRLVVKVGLVDVQQADDAVDGGADVVAHAGEEPAFGLVGLLGLGRHLPQLGVFGLQGLKGVDVAVYIHRHHLVVAHIGPGPPVLVLPAVHGEAAPDAVDVPVVEQVLLFLPVDDGELRLIAHAGEGLAGQFDVDARQVAVYVHIAEGRIGVVAHGDGGPVLVRLGPGHHAPAAGQNARQQTG